jgi:rRNA maturation endonuclease Nob1
MTLLTSQLALLAALTTAAGAVMVRLGLSRGMLQLRKTERRCPACGRLVRGRVCPWCAGPGGSLRSAPSRTRDSHL